MRTFDEKLNQASTFVTRTAGDRLVAHKPVIAIVLGSGLSNFTSRVTNCIEIPYADIPGFPESTVPGHAGKLVIGDVVSRPVLIWSGRTHYYEGRSPAEITFYVHLTAAMGIDTIFLSNAAGALTRDFQPGDLMVIDDHINLMGMNPLRGPNYKFIDMTYAYDPELRALMDSVAMDLGIKLHHGVYVGVAGPSYETPAEIRAFSNMGGHAVGMSTVPEVIAANAVGMRVAAISCITNLAAGLSPTPLAHDEVKTAALRAEKAFGDLVQGIIQRL